VNNGRETAVDVALAPVSAVLPAGQAAVRPRPDGRQRMSVEYITADAEARVAEADSAQGASGTQILKSVCRSCHGGCGTLLHVRDGVLIRVEGDPESPLNKGRLCPIGANSRELVYHPDRLKYPMRRRGPRGSCEW